MPVHERLDIARWIAEFPLDKEREAAHQFVLRRCQTLPSAYQEAGSVEHHCWLMGPGGEEIVGPRSIAIAEQLRIEAMGTHPDGARSLGEGIETDVLVWGMGPPSRSAASKIGGVPHRPANAPWPRDKRGDPAQFLAQLCFADSQDLVRRAFAADPCTDCLPDEVMVMFATDATGRWDGDETGEIPLIFEWWPVVLPKRMTLADMPSRAAPFGEYHAQLHRTFDYPRVPRDHPLFKPNRSWLLDELQATKIGGSPHWIQGHEARPGTYLASLSHMVPYGDRWPLFNHPNPMLNADAPGIPLGDSGCVVFYLDRAHNQSVVRWTMQCG